jgi:hypothetical protein
VVADALSQRPSPALTAEDWPEEGLAAPDRPILAAIADAQPVDFSAMAAAQRACPKVAEMMNSSTLQITTQAVGNATLLGDVSTGVFRLLILIQHREAVFQSLHSIHHPGVRATCRLIAARFCWPQMAKAITQMARACLHCQRGKVHRHVHLQPTEIPVPHRRFVHLHVDLVGPLSPSLSRTRRSSPEVYFAMDFEFLLRARALYFFAQKEELYRVPCLNTGIWRLLVYYNKGSAIKVL